MKMKNRFKYTEEQVEFLRNGYQSMNTRNLTTAFNDKYGTSKAETAIRSCLTNHKITCGRKHGERLITPFRVFNEEHEDFIRSICKGRTKEQITEMFNDRFGTEMKTSQIRTVMNNRGITSDLDMRFTKGHEPWNKGTKGLGLTGPNKGSFKKGNVPANRKPLGHERICTKNGFILIKIAERNPYTGHPTRYKAKHVHIWEQKNGPVPEGMVLFFIDANPLHCEISNLMLITRAELLALNQYGYRETPDEVKPSLIALVRLRVRTFEKAKRAAGL